MLVTQISEVTKSRCRIYLDGEFAFVLYKGELRQFQIKENQELSEESYRKIMTQILPKRAKLRCMNLLQSRDYTKSQLEEKLRQGDYPRECIEEALAYVESCGYIDDERYAKDYIEYHIGTRSKARIETDLQKKGIAKDTVRAAFDKLADTGIKQDEDAMIRDLLRKKNYCADGVTDREKQRMYGFLYRRGFSRESILRALS